MTNRRSRPVLLALSALAFVLVVVAHRLGDATHEELPSLVQRADEVVAIREPGVELFTALEPVASTSRQSAARSPIAAEKPVRPQLSPRRKIDSPGQLAVVVRDATTSAPLTGVRVRAVDVSRVADRSSDRREPAPVLRLTPRDYSLYVSALGYEPVELAPVRVVAEETTTTAPIYLVPGSARIDGRVASDPPAGATWRAELIGEGRRPCARCERAPCPHCGFAADGTRVVIGADGNFAFDRLASGIYLLRIVDADERECSEALRIVLHPAQRSYFVLEAAPPRTIRIALEDVDGASIADLWSSRVSCGPTSNGGKLNVDRQDIAWDCVFEAHGTRVARGSFVTPPPAGMTYRTAHRVSCGGCGFGNGGRDDRLRAPAEELRPAPVVPSFEITQLEPSVDGRGHVVVEHVPARVDRVEVRLGRFSARIALGASTQNVQRARLTLEEPGFPATFREHGAWRIERHKVR